MSNQLVAAYCPPFYPENIPRELKEIARWAWWFAETDENGKIQKRPRHSTRRPEEWGQFDRDLAVCREGARKGLGICVTGFNAYTFIDLDGCIDEDESVHPFASDVMRRLGGYWETSPSGRGLRGAVRCALGWDMAVHKSASPHGIGVEFYNGVSARYLTMTGDEYFLSDGELSDVDPAVFEAIREELGGQRITGTAEASCEVPDVLDIEELPMLETLPLSDTAQRLLMHGDEGEDGSLALMRTVESLVACGLDDAMVVSLIVHNAAAFDICMRHRHQDSVRATEYLVKHHLAPAKARVRVSEADLEDLLDPEAIAMSMLPPDENTAEADVNPPMRLDEALRRLVFVRGAKAVHDTARPWVTYKYDVASMVYASSKQQVPAGGGRTKVVPMLSIWVESSKRLTVDAVTYRPGAGVVTVDPFGLQAVNEWRPVVRDGEAGDPTPFIEHVQWLFGDRADDFLDWLAHIEQEPGVLPHTCWLHIAPKTGCGRNWMASVLAAVWRGHVAPDQELDTLLSSQFNNVLGGAHLCVINEIRDTHLNRWAAAEKFKALMNPEYREINRKYGIKTVEYNVCRWLIFSNHHNAMPVDAEDRRIEVVTLDEAPKDLDYYTRLYGLLRSPAFINGVGRYLAQRDISGFSPGRHAVMSEAKVRLLAMARSDVDVGVEDLIDEWPTDLIFTDDMLRVLGVQKFDRPLQIVLSKHGARTLSKRPRVGGKSKFVVALRNAEIWETALPSRVAQAAATGNDEYLRRQLTED